MNAIVNMLRLILLAFLVFTQSVYGANEKNHPCESEKYRAFDFWLGEWLVTSPNQKTPPSHSSITRSNKGCSIHERYTTAGGYTGNSINFYDKKSNRWHQTWIDNQGAPLYLDGEFTNGSMVLSDGNNRISWRLLENKQVNQIWEVTTDNGKTWEKIFDGFYTRSTSRCSFQCSASKFEQGITRRE